MPQNRRLPYGLPIVDSCVACRLRNQTSFCMMSECATKELDARKHVNLYPQRAVIFLERQEARGVYIVCQGPVANSPELPEVATARVGVNLPSLKG